MKMWIWLVIILVIVGVVLIVRANNKAKEETAKLVQLQQQTTNTNSASLLNTIKGWFKKDEEGKTAQDLQDEADENWAFNNLTEEELWS